MLIPTIICLGVALIVVILSCVSTLSILSQVAKQDEQLAEFGNRFEIETESGDVFEVEVEVEEEHDEEYCEDCKSKFN
jgi:hypothetical protein